MTSVPIPLTNGGVAIVDSSDLAALNCYKWRANKRSDGTVTGVVSGNSPDLLFMHRVITGAADGVLIDHKDGNPLNNARANLRACSHAQNMKNRRRHSNNRSGFKGVYAEERAGGTCWYAQIRVDGTKYSLGSHDPAELAYAAYCRAAKLMHGEFARFA